MSIDVDGSWDDRKLPLWATIRQSYVSYFTHFPDVLRATLPWLVIGTGAVAGATWLQLGWLIEAVTEAQRNGRPQVPEMPLGTMLLPHLGYLVLNIGLASIAVAWHRRVIIDEQPSPTAIHIITGRFWRYVGIYIAIALVSLITVLALTVPMFVGLKMLGREAQPVLNVVVPLGIAVIFACAIGVLCRLLPLLPARAIDDYTPTFSETWQRTRGNTWRLFLGILACTLLPVLPVYFIAALAVGVGYPPSGDALSRFTVFSAFTTSLFILICPIFVGFLSHAYQHFFEEA